MNARQIEFFDQAAVPLHILAVAKVCAAMDVIASRIIGYACVPLGVLSR
jgi:hypothetical protein